MQYLEASDLGVRSAIYHLRRQGSNLESVLFPMLHVGSRAFYEAVHQQLSACDVIFVEGVPHRAVVQLTAAQRAIQRIKRLNLVTQRALDLRELDATLIYTDLPGDEFDAHWKALSWLVRLTTLATVPLAVIVLYLFGSRELLASRCTLDDIPSTEEAMLLQDPGYAELEELVIDRRDARLLGHIRWFIEDHAADDLTVAILYGARHMRAVTTLLLGPLHYRVASAEWCTVFTL